LGNTQSSVANEKRKHEKTEKKVWKTAKGRKPKVNQARENKKASSNQGEELRITGGRRRENRGFPPSIRRRGQFLATQQKKGTQREGKEGEGTGGKHLVKRKERGVLRIP